MPTSRLIVIVVVVVAMVCEAVTPLLDVRDAIVRQAIDREAIVAEKGRGRRETFFFFVPLLFARCR